MVTIPELQAKFADNQTPPQQDFYDLIDRTAMGNYRGHRASHPAEDDPDFVLTDTYILIGDGLLYEFNGTSMPRLLSRISIGRIQGNPDFPTARTEPGFHVTADGEWYHTTNGTQWTLWDVAANKAQIDANTANIASNQADIQTNKDDIAEIQNTGYVVPTIDELFALSPVDGSVATTRGYRTRGIGSGQYQYDASSTLDVNGGTVLPGVGGVMSLSSTGVFNGTAGTGRWLLMYQGTSEVYAEQFGAEESNTVNQYPSIQAFVNAWMTNIFDGVGNSRFYRCDSTVVIDKAGSYFRSLRLGTVWTPASLRIGGVKVSSSSGAITLIGDFNLTVVKELESNLAPWDANDYDYAERFYHKDVRGDGSHINGSGQRMHESIAAETENGIILNNVQLGGNVTLDQRYYAVGIGLYSTGTVSTANNLWNTIKIPRSEGSKFPLVLANNGQQNSNAATNENKIEVGSMRQPNVTKTRNVYPVVFTDLGNDADARKSNNNQIEILDAEPFNFTGSEQVGVILDSASQNEIQFGRVEQNNANFLLYRATFRDPISTCSTQNIVRFRRTQGNTGPSRSQIKWEDNAFCNFAIDDTNPDTLPKIHSELVREFAFSGSDRMISKGLWGRTQHNSLTTQGWVLPYDDDGAQDTRVSDGEMVNRQSRQLPSIQMTFGGNRSFPGKWPTITVCRGGTALHDMFFFLFDAAGNLLAFTSPPADVSGRWMHSNSTSSPIIDNTNGSVSRHRSQSPHDRLTFQFHPDVAKVWMGFGGTTRTVTIESDWLDTLFSAPGVDDRWYSGGITALLDIPERGYFTANQPIAVVGLGVVFASTDGYAVKESWNVGNTYEIYDWVSNAGNIYESQVVSKLGGTGPTHTTGTVDDWKFIATGSVTSFA